MSRVRDRKRDRKRMFIHRDLAYYYTMRRRLPVLWLGHLCGHRDAEQLWGVAFATDKGNTHHRRSRRFRRARRAFLRP